MATKSTTSEAGQVRLQQLSIVSPLKKGYLLKRQRGQRPNADFRKLKFQQRYICLTQDSLHYHMDQKVNHNVHRTSVLVIRL